MAGPIIQATRKTDFEDGRMVGSQFKDGRSHYRFTLYLKSMLPLLILWAHQCLTFYVQSEVFKYMQLLLWC